MNALERELADHLIFQLDQNRDYDERAAMVLSDTIVVMLKGSVEPEVVRLAESLTESGGRSTMLSGRAPTTAERAAFVNATSGSFLELDEGVRPTGHPGIHVVPALLAEVQEHSRSVHKSQFFASLTLGYEIIARLADVLAFDGNVHPHGHIGSVGTAAAIAFLRTGDSQQVAHAMAVAGSLPLRTDWRPCFTGDTVRNSFAGLGSLIGMMACNLAMTGFTAEEGALERLFAPALGSGLDVQKFLRPLDHWAIHHGYHKFYASCALTHPSIEAALQLRRHPLEPLDPDAIAKIEVSVPKRYVRTRHLPNGTRLSAKFSTPWAVAGALLTGCADDTLYHDPWLSDRSIAALARRITVQEDNVLTDQFPYQAGSHVTIVWKSGRRQTETCREPVGGSSRGVTWDELEHKTRQLFPSIDPNTWHTLTHLPEDEPVSRWWEHLLNALP
jgi:2-methylcitrate dehydratase PrpD